MDTFSSDRLSVRNPRTGVFDYEIQVPNSNDIRNLSFKLRKGQLKWVSLTISERIDVMQMWKEAIITHKSALIAALSEDTGRKAETILEVELVATSIDRWCGIAKDFFQISTPRTSSIPFLSIQQGLVPYNIVAVISPWNFPLLLSLIDTIPALLAGCAVVVKPSEVTLRFVNIINETIAAVPALAMVLAYVGGAGETGATLIQEADLVCFTGSTATGRKVYQAACDRFIPVFLELGGKDAALVFEGANLDNASSALLWGSSVNAGQSCLSIERIYAQDTIFDDFVSCLVSKAAQVNLAFPTMDDGQIGPIISEKQVIIINEHLQDALRKGAKILPGSSQCEELGGGYYCRPTVMVNVNHSMKIMNEETFGPIMPVMSFAHQQEAIDLANGTIHGLSGAVFAATNEIAMGVASQMTAGAISINDAALTAVMHEGEKNSFKMSGIGGTRMGPAAIKRFMRQKAFLIKTNENPDPWWFWIMTYSAQYWIEKYNMLPHPEGGYFVETYRSKETLALGTLPTRFKGIRSLCTGIYFLLENHHYSAFHRIQSDEMWHFYAGGALEIFVIDETGHLNIIKLGNNPERGEVFQAVVPAGCWFGSKPSSDAIYSLVGCTVAPGFDFADFELAAREELLKVFPQHTSLIEILTPTSR